MWVTRHFLAGVVVVTAAAPMARGATPPDPTRAFLAAWTNPTVGEYTLTGDVALTCEMVSTAVTRPSDDRLAAQDAFHFGDLA
jgi:hypothetical protein